MVRLEDYGLIKNLNVPDEAKGIIKKAIIEKCFNENMIRDDLKHFLNAQSSTGVNPNIFSMGGQNTNSFINQHSCNNLINKYK